MAFVRFSPEAFPDLQCTAKSKRSGKRCRKCRRPGWKVCRMHGAGGRQRTNPQNTEEPTGTANERNRAVKMGRRLAREAARDVPQEVHREFARSWAARVPAADHERFLLALWHRMEGALNTQGWIDVQRQYGLLDER